MKIGRNEKCPCGSGKKYKRCCQLKINQSDSKEYENELIQYFGYNTPRGENDSPFELPEEGLCCMVSSVNKDIQTEINAKLDYPLLELGKGQWVITANVGNQVKFSGPYNSYQLAMESAKEKFGAIRFMSTPEIF